MAFWSKFTYLLRNWRAHLRAFVKGTTNGPPGGDVVFTGELSATIFRAGGEQEELGVICRRVVTDVGVQFMAQDFAGGVKDITALNYHDSGIGTNAESAGDTDLQTPAGPTTRATGTQTNPANGQYRTVGVITYSGPLAITEHGVFSQASRGGGSVLWDRSVFAPINVQNQDSIQFQYTLTINSGG